MTAKTPERRPELPEDGKEVQLLRAVPFEDVAAENDEVRLQGVDLGDPRPEPPLPDQRPEVEVGREDHDRSVQLRWKAREPDLLLADDRRPEPLHEGDQREPAREGERPAPDRARGARQEEPEAGHDVGEEERREEEKRTPIQLAPTNSRMRPRSPAPKRSAKRAAR